MEEKNSKQIYSAEFIFIGIISIIVYLSFFLFKIEYFTKYIHSENTIFFTIVFQLLLLIFLYFLGFRIIKKAAISIKLIFYFFLVFNLICAFILPLASTDLFNYISQARVFTVFHANPYTEIYSNFPQDALYNDLFNYWSSHPSPYGPLFVIFSSALSNLGGNNLIINLFLFKLFFFGINCLIFYFLYKISNDKSIIFLYSWNPIFLFEFIVNGHNDILTILFLIISLYYLFKASGSLKYYFLSWLFLVFSALIKHLPVIFFPILFLIILKKLNGRQKIIFAFFGPIMAIIIALIFYMPFLSGNIFSYFLIFSTKISREIPDNFMAFFELLSLMFKLNLPTLSILFAGKILFIIFYFIAFLKILIDFKKLNKNDFIKYSGIVLFLFLFLFVSFLLPWYLTNLLFLLILYIALEKKYNYINYVFALSAYTALYYLIIR